MEKVIEDYKKSLLTILVLALILLGIYGLTQRSQKQHINESVRTEENYNLEDSVSYKGVEGVNALELLKTLYEVETKEYSGIGEFVTSINGKDAGDTHYWSFIINGEMSSVGASDFITKEGDLIEWKLEEIK